MAGFVRKLGDFTVKLSRPAQKLWDQVPVEVRVKLLNNVLVHKL